MQMNILCALYASRDDVSDGDMDEVVTAFDIDEYVLFESDFTGEYFAVLRVDLDTLADLHSDVLDHDDGISFISYDTAVDVLMKKNPTLCGASAERTMSETVQMCEGWMKDTHNPRTEPVTSTNAKSSTVLNVFAKSRTPHRVKPAEHVHVPESEQIRDLLDM